MRVVIFRESLFPKHRGNHAYCSVVAAHPHFIKVSISQTWVFVKGYEYHYDTNWIDCTGANFGKIRRILIFGHANRRAHIDFHQGVRFFLQQSDEYPFGSYSAASFPPSPNNITHVAMTAPPSPLLMP